MSGYLDGGSAESVYGGLCYPATAIWPDPSILPVVPPAPADPDNLTEEEQALEDAYDMASGQLEIALALAWTELQSKTAGAIAICPITVRPCKRGCEQGTYYVAPVVGGSGWSPFWPTVRNGLWTNVWCGHGDCSCTSVEEIILTGTVGEVVEVMIDGEIVDPSAYRVDNHSRLVRQDGGGWPTCQNMNAPAGEEGTFTVKYYAGATADITVRYAAGVLATEYLKAITGDATCRLPDNTIGLVRQGISVQMDIDDTLTNIHEVDAVIKKFNPNLLKMKPSVYSNDRKPARQTTFGG